MQVVKEPSGSVFDRSDVRRIKARLDPLGETMTYIERLEAITKAAATHLDLWDGDTEETENALADALDAIAWTVE